MCAGGSLRRSREPCLPCTTDGHARATSTLASLRHPLLAANSQPAVSCMEGPTGKKPSPLPHGAKRRTTVPMAVKHLHK